jgi:hypothetical protein
LRKNAHLWAGDLDLTDPLVSPLFGSLAGLPPTAVYAGSLEIVAPDVLVLQDKALATPGADFTFILRKGEIHDWAALTIFPETRAVLPDIYQQLGISGSEAAVLDDSLVGAITKGLVTESPTLTGQSIEPVSTGETATLEGVSDLTANPQPTANATEDPWTGEPSIVNQFFVGAFRVLGAVGRLFGAPSLITFLASPSFAGRVRRG